ncbi:MAG: GTPase [Candidatus Shikimatogenerans sp. Tduv]|uniref:GTPase n=1 Tax=Candidatus Shikimatogenerans sp. Tduv TaxID=3158567 RepID=A0AAU7QTY3_9FLAO
MKLIIIGRSNVGKSTLFNKIINKNKAIVYNIKYLTKDINTSYFKWNNNYHLISDTGGINFKKKKIYNKIYNKILKTIKKYDIILLILSYKDGLLYLDKKIFNKFKLFKKKIYIIVNKVDNNYTYKIYDFYNIGVKKIYYISAINNTGISDLLDNILKNKNIKKEKKKKNNKINISIIGRQNVGKSTLFNTFFNKNKNIISNIKGTTIDYIKKIYNKYNLYFNLIDTPGIKKNKNKKIEHIIYKKNIKIIKNTHICLFMIDINLGFLKEEYNILKILIKYYKFTIIIFNKIDLLNKKYINNYIKYFNNFFKKKIYSYKNIKINYISAKYKKNIFNILKNIKIINKILKFRITSKKKKNIKNYLNNIFYKKKNFYIKKIKQIFIFNNITFLILYKYNIINNKYKKFIINYIKQYINILYPINFIFKKK